MIGHEEFAAMLERVGISKSAVEQCKAWGIDHIAYAELMNHFCGHDDDDETDERRTTFQAGFEFGYLARLELDTQEALK